MKAALCKSLDGPAGLVIEEWSEPAVKQATDQRAILVVRARR